ncbi:TBCC domain-containing protein 1 [Tetrabaena socialis]|uniref:TBCC domain-containing protein 1 n=1 Tax=Tetrabaena socialis TaxID=47790 RepID=A0A2J8AHK9_9CHLO|nr:TBCC domain-containing protein 1 [Tetrabaena socialis]|eukprot:PNH12003.1 TBCC domain-containing protein 1 [Tetrabaena socialis]
MQPRREVWEYGALPLQALCPQLDGVQALLSFHGKLFARSKAGQNGQRTVVAADLALVLELTPNQASAEAGGGREGPGGRPGQCVKQGQEQGGQEHRLGSVNRSAAWGAMPLMAAAPPRAEVLTEVLAALSYGNSTTPLPAAAAAAAADGAAGTAGAPPAPPPLGAEHVHLHELSLFLLAQLFSKEAQRADAIEYWPDPGSSGFGMGGAGGMGGFAAAIVSGCSDCTIVVGAVGRLLRVERCDKVQVIAATNRLLVSACHECAFNVGCPRPPLLIGDNRFLRLGPYNTRYERQAAHAREVGLRCDLPNRFDQPLVLVGKDRSKGLAGSSAPNSPRLGMGSSSGSAAAAATKACYSLQPPEEMLPFVVPFVGSGGALAGLTKEKERELNDAIQGYFKEWLVGSNLLRQIYDLSTLEKEEMAAAGAGASVGLSPGSSGGGAPPPAGAAAAGAAAEPRGGV